MQYAWYAAAINICLRIHLLIFLTTVANVILTFNKHAFPEGTMISKKIFVNCKGKLACAFSWMGKLYKIMLSSCAVFWCKASQSEQNLNWTKSKIDFPRSFRFNCIHSHTQSFDNRQSKVSPYIQFCIASVARLMLANLFCTVHLMVWRYLNEKSSDWLKTLIT